MRTPKTRRKEDLVPSTPFSGAAEKRPVRDNKKVGAAFDKTVLHRIPLEATSAFMDHYFQGTELAGKRVLEAGCRVGDYSMAFLRKGAGAVLGIDVSQRSVETARKIHQHPALRFEVASVVDLTRFPAGSFDIAICSSTLSYLSPKDVRQALDELARVLVSDGTLLVLVVRKPSLPLRLAISAINRLPAGFQSMLAYGSRFAPRRLASLAVGRAVDRERLEYLVWGLRGLRFDGAFEALEPGRMPTLESVDCSAKTLVSFKCQLEHDGRFVAASKEALPFAKARPNP